MEVKGNKNQDQLSMFNDIFLVASSRINFTDPTLFIQQASIDEDLYDNIVRFQITVMNGVQKDQIGLFPADSMMFTSVPGNANNQNAALGPYGSALMMSAKKQFFNPCSNAPDFSFNQQAADDLTVSSDFGSDGAEQDLPATPATGTMSPEQLVNPYIKWKQTIEYDQDNGTILIPSTGGLAGKVYQLRTPHMVVRQYGTAVRVGDAVVPPLPQTNYNGHIKVKRVIPMAPTPMPDKVTLSYSASWYYEILVPFTDSDLITSNTGSQTFVDTTAGTSGNEYNLPGNAAVVFNPASDKLLALAAPISVSDIA